MRHLTINKDLSYAQRRFRIFMIGFGGWLIVMTIGLIGKFGWVEDINTIKLLMFTALCGGGIMMASIWAYIITALENWLFKRADKNE